MSLDSALKLYGLERMEVLWERRHDTMALIAWGNNRVVVVFRGTNSLKNVLADLEVPYSAHPGYCCAYLPAVGVCCKPSLLLSERRLSSKCLKRAREPSHEVTSSCILPGEKLKWPLPGFCPHENLHWVGGATGSR